MSISSVKTPNQIRQDIIVMQDCLQKYRQLVSEHQAIHPDAMRAKSFFERLVWQIEKGIPQIALFTLISTYQDDNTREQFYEFLDVIIMSLREFYDRYQKEYLGRLFDFNDFIHTYRVDRYFAQIDSLFTEASAIAAPIIIQELE